jgi:hypothetical protein
LLPLHPTSLLFPLGPFTQVSAPSRAFPSLLPTFGRPIKIPASVRFPAKFTVINHQSIGPDDSTLHPSIKSAPLDSTRPTYLPTPANQEKGSHRHHPTPYQQDISGMSLLPLTTTRKHGTDRGGHHMRLEQKVQHHSIRTWSPTALLTGPYVA